MLLPRMTTRRWMIAVAIVGIGLLACRYFVFRALAAYHESKTAWSIACTDRGCIYRDHNGKFMTRADVAASPWHEKVSKIYRSAARRPWLAAEPIPPEPPEPPILEIEPGPPTPQ
jgi:hypothetical protein